ncbi:MAG: N-acetyltransferase [Rickettsiales bacterium]|nr:N-acetyltransferase [Pseudomonadota bacterium]MDA0966094.1 N-acetyltransferase [Pseudomonadota bacterium]MDG4543241.1 N-acetyltransferase [Rickettsiales bacterium]MDG4545439.1 N-acetyltransferase [Rickettsiales bacterium]MDG4547888.1 N-acetyltransferase [Rickettsiales bacterium]
MASKIKIRKTNKDDISSMELLYKKAFPDEELFPLIIELFDDKQNVTSICAFINSHLVGHVALSKCYVSSKKYPLALLGPLAVMPEYQRQGIGSSLIRHGFDSLKSNGFLKLLVLGDPNFYKSFGFEVETKIQPAYPIPKEWETAWQSFTLSEGGEEPEGTLEVPNAWQKQELWS